MLASLGDFLGCPRLCLTRAREAKVTKGDLALGFIRMLFAGNISV